MARNQSNPLKIAGVLGVVVALFALVGGGAFFLLNKGDSFAGLPPFPVDAYLNGGNLWSSDEYKIEGRVDNVIYRSRAKDQLVASIQPEGSRMRLPVVMESAPGKKAVQLEQELVLRVTLGPGQEIVCRDYATR